MTVGFIQNIEPVQFIGDAGSQQLIPEWVPEDAQQYADFTNANYWDDGIGSVGDILTENSEFGSFDPGMDITPGTGVTASQPVFTNSVEMLASGFTVICEFTQNGQQLAFNIYDIPTWEFGGFSIEIIQDNAFGATSIITVEGGSSANLVPITDAGVHKVAFTFNPTLAKIAVSIDGAAVVSATGSAPVDPAFNVVGINANCTIQSIAVLPLKADAELPALSASP